MPALEAVLSRVDANMDDALKRLFSLLAIPSISTDPAYAPDCLRAANLLRDDLESVGFDAAVRPTAGHPMVVARAKSGASGAPHVLFYGHYDVQPADPLDLWETEPFAPRLDTTPAGKRIVARGAADDKGQLMTFIEACRAYLAEGGLPCDVTVLLEGEEETGSPSLPAFLDANKEELRADLMLVCDTNMWNRDTPMVTAMLRGLALEEVTIRAASRDLHSGLFGGAAVNPIQVLAKIIAGLRDDKGAITLPGFYDGVAELPEDVAEQWRAIPFKPADFLGAVGLSQPAGEAGRGVLEQIWSRPACDVNGISGGYAGAGSKTVLPARASAKFSFRLVGKQDPEKVLESFRAYVRKALPPDCRAEFTRHGASPALQLPFSSEALSRARRALLAEWGKEPIIGGSGGSIPIVGDFKRLLGMDALMIGFGLDDDRIHSPNEKYEMSSFHKGARSWARVLDALAN